MRKQPGQLSPSELFDKVWSTLSGQALSLYGDLGLRRTTEAGGPAHRSAERMAKVQARARRRYERRKAKGL